MKNPLFELPVPLVGFINFPPFRLEKIETDDDSVIGRITGPFSGGKFLLKNSADSAVTNGRHLVIVQEVPGELSAGSEFLIRGFAEPLAQWFAKTYCEEGRYRIAWNGPGVAKVNAFHIHIICPMGDDKLPRLTSKFEPPDYSIRIRKV